MVDVEKITGNDVRDILMKKPEILERLIGITMDRDTLKNEHWIDVHPGRQKLDFYFQDTEGKHYVVKVAFKEKPLNALRHPNIWQKRWAEINKLDIEQVVPILIIDEETVNADPKSKKDFDGFRHIKIIQYKIADIAKEF